MGDLFQFLHPALQKWIYKQGWEDLRDIQKKAIRPILASNSDLVISASTAGGKTEAAFLPAITAIADESSSFGILYISPLKALINDQFRRLEDLCDMLDIKVTPWHGDISQSKKKNAKRNPEGILLITPESLESLLIRESGWVRTAFESLKYVIIDEYHAFLGTERGCHLHSLIYRLETLLNRNDTPIPRIALSATLGNMDDVLANLRPNNPFPRKLITDSGKSSLRMQIRGYLDRKPIERESPTDREIATDIYELLRGDTNLIFANSRQRTEHFSVMLSDLCEENQVPNEFFAHHGSLSKELRTSLESRLQKQKLPTTAVCTMTLELGIDIGKVKSVAQVTAPHSVSSLRQRLGRSGRRGDPAILRMFITENKLRANSNIIDKLRMQLLQSAAMIRLLIDQKWYEPADTRLFHFSTLLHQILAVTAQWGGVRVEQLWSLLCKSEIFKNVNIDHFRTLLRTMGEKRLISQMSSGELVLGDQGENLVDHYTFYAVFKTPEEYRIVVEGKTLGTLPVNSPVIPGQHIVFAGRRWKIKDIDEEKKVIHVIPSKAGMPPIFGGDGMSVHDYVRQEMLRIYLEGDYRIDAGGRKVDFMDPTAKDLFSEGLNSFRDLKLRDRHIISHSGNAYLIPWMGDKIVNTLTVFLIGQGYEARCFAGVVEIEGADSLDVAKSLKTFNGKNKPKNTSLAELVKNKQTEKYDYLLPESLLNEGYGAKAFDVVQTNDWIKKADNMNFL
ncbi:MAG: DEAD/DEAH box helicase [Candidatus Dadabacteria bacterium]|nr:DEAD/DEAH box helicase [Candidatus Dadabacteria bacterium]